MSHGQHLSAVDAAWYRMDTPRNTADIVALITFAEPLDVDRLRRIIEARFSQFPQFSRRVVDPGAGLPQWADALDFDIADHIQHTRLETGTKQELQEFVSGILTRDLNRDRPLWELHVVDNVVEGSAIVVKLHHCLGDGFALVGVLLSLTDDAIDPPSSAMDEVVESGHTSLFDDLGRLVRHPERLVDAAALTGRAAASLGELLLLPFDPQTSLTNQLTGIRRAAWSHGVPLERFKEIARARGGTLNDVLLTTLTGAVRGWLAELGDDVDSGSIRAVVPVNLRPVEEMGQALGNKFGLVFFDMPIDKADLEDRHAHVRSAMARLKESPEAIVSFGILAGIGVLPDVVEHIATDVFARKGSLVVTNVPGPREPLRLAGKLVDHVMFWVPHPSTLGLGVSLLSYAGEVRIGVRADTGITNDPARLVEWFELELERAAET